MRTPILNGLGQAIRWLRDRRGRKQYEVAETAGITKGMLSAYETGRQRPSLETLEKILDTLGCDLNDLHNAIQIINGRPEGMRRRRRLGAKPRRLSGEIFGSPAKAGAHFSAASKLTDGPPPSQGNASWKAVVVVVGRKSAAHSAGCRHR